MSSDGLVQPELPPPVRVYANKPNVPVLFDLDEREAYLFAILTDVSGLDQAEFLWFDPSVDDNKMCAICGSKPASPHRYDHDELPGDERWVDDPEWAAASGCFRAWAYQHSWWRNKDPKQIECNARSTGKSLSVKSRGCAFPFVHPGEEMVITAPELVHLEPIVGLIETQFNSCRLLSEFLPRSKSAVTHRPFMMNFVNGARIIGRIPQRDGRGIKGVHPIWLEMDESQDYPHAGWLELTETLKRGFEGATWRAHGVTRGVRDDFFEFTSDSPDNPWTVHRFSAMWRPNWSNEEREEKIAQYGSKDDPDYRRNVLGLHGDKTNPIFVISRLMECVDNDALTDYNLNEYYHEQIKIETLGYNDQSILDVIDLPAGHLTYAGDPAERISNPKAIFWSGMDIGFTVDPSEIVTFVEYRVKPKDEHTIFKLLSRISLVRMPHREQILAILAVIDHYRPKAFSMDKNGVGLTMWNEMVEIQEAFGKGQVDRIAPEMLPFASSMSSVLTTIKGYSFSEKLVTGLDATIELDPGEDQLKQAQRRNAKEYSTDILRELVDHRRLLLPWDSGFLKEFQGASYVSVRGMQDAYGKRLFSQGNDHCLAAGTMVTTVRGLVPIELVAVGDEVATRAGWKKVERAWCASASAPTYDVEFSDGRVLTATAEHLIHAEHSWIPVARLMVGDNVTAWHPDQGSFSATSLVSSPRTAPVASTFRRRAAERSPFKPVVELLRVVRVTPSGQREVYDLTVQDQPEFFANGVLVHNCLDASRNALLGWAQDQIERTLSARVVQEPVLDSFVMF